MKPWDMNADQLIVHFLDVAGAQDIANDLGRTEAAITARAKKLKDTGAWGHLQSARESELRYELAVGCGHSSFRRELVDEQLKSINADRKRGGA